ncbi:MAG: S53 family peptidase [Vulcanimicrobiaceae bacterium]
MIERKLVVALVAATMVASCAGGGGQASLPPIPGSANAGNSVRHSSVAIAVPAGWSSTATQGVTVANATDSGPLNPSQVLTVRLSLALHNPGELAQLVAAGQRFSDAQMAAYLPTGSDVGAVENYLKSQGFTNVSAAPDNLLVDADGTAAVVKKAFDTSLESFSLGGVPVFANTTPALVPQSLGGIVNAVLGLNNAAKMALGPKKSTDNCYFTGPTPQGTPCAHDYGPHDIQLFYDTGNTPAATGTTISVMAEGDVSSVVTDLAYAENTLGTPHVPVTVVRVGYPSPDTSGVIEWALDTQSSTGIAGNVKQLYIYATTSLTDSDIANEYNHWASADLAQLGNSSFGECEYQAYLDGSMKADDQVFLYAAAHGQTMFASSGDTGSSCALAPTNGVPGSGPPMVSFPASSPWVTAVGGTTIASNSDGTYLGEVAWNSGGGGVSQFENATSWEEPVQVTTGVLAAGNLRGVPDIAMDADPTTGPYDIYAPAPFPDLGPLTCTSPCGVGGTSLASPLAMGVYARMLTAHPSLGYAPPVLYHNYVQYESGETLVQGPPPTESYGGFHDIVTGGNGAFTALPGYDYITGLGTFDVSALNATIAQ